MLCDQDSSELIDRGTKLIDDLQFHRIIWHFVNLGDQIVRPLQFWGPKWRFTGSGNLNTNLIIVAKTRETNWCKIYNQFSKSKLTESSLSTLWHCVFLKTQHLKALRIVQGRDTRSRSHTRKSPISHCKPVVS
jgi:hypothetical protein